MSCATTLMPTLLICAALTAPLPVRASPAARWKFAAGPHPLTVIVALGPSDIHRLKSLPAPRRAHRLPIDSLPQTVTGWTRPLGLSVALRW